MTVEKGLVNVIVIGFGFLFLFMAFLTLGNAQKYLFISIRHDDPTFNGNAYISLGLVFASLAIVNILAPTVISAIGPRVSLIIAGISQLFYQGQFLYPMAWSLYLTSAICGIAGGLIWSAQGRYVTQNATIETLTSYSGIFWGISQLGRFLGNLYVFFRFQSKVITTNERNELYGLMLGSCALAIVFFVALRKAVFGGDNKKTPKEAFIMTMKLFTKRDMLILFPTFLYCGLQSAFYTGIYSNAVGFTEAFDYIDIKLIALAGIFVGLGESVGGTIFGIFGEKTVKKGHFPIIIAGTLIHLLASCVIFVNMPNDSVFGPTFENGIIRSDMYIALLCAFLVGFGDACFITQIYGLLGKAFYKEIAQAHSVFRCISAAGTTASYIYANKIGMYWVLAILMIVSVLAAGCFTFVELKPKEPFSRVPFGIPSLTDIDVIPLTRSSLKIVK